MSKNLPPALMILGTSSDAGKSLIAAGLCRLFARRGVRVAPFKAQNMALNSFVTKSGGEMGRAQVVQAECAGIEPDVRMNPILLKPSGDRGSQVVVLGKPIGHFDARGYYRLKKKMQKEIQAAYRSIAHEYDLMILEGAGSPAEINLKSKDIVNGWMAKQAGARCLLVTDIDRGGSFASLVGTMACLDQEERALVKGFIFNKFRGDVSLLKPGFGLLQKMTGKPTFGVVPYLKNLLIDAEDSVGLGLKVQEEKEVVIGVVRHPRISNFSDLNALLPFATIRYLDGPPRTDPDCVILPGTKNTLADFKILQKSGLAGWLLAFAKKGGRIVGICGGYQMIGKRLLDPGAIESPNRALSGLGLLPVETTLLPEKQLRQVSGKTLSKNGFCPVGLAVLGYEIHHGETIFKGSKGRPLFRLDNEKADGAVSPNGKIWGTYLHGVFDADEFRRYFLNTLRREKGLVPLDRKTCAGFRKRKEKEYDRLADALEASLDLKRIFNLVGFKK